MNLKNLLTRTIAGIVYIALVLLGILGKGFFFISIFTILLGLALYEFYRLTEKNNPSTKSRVFNTIAGVTFFLLPLLPQIKMGLTILSIALLLYLILIFSNAVFSKKENTLRNAINSVFGQIYITLPFLLLQFISQLDGSLNNSEYALLAIFVFIWVNDTAAYVVGSLFGKNKLIEHISPKKTIEGFVGGVCFTIIAGLVFAKLTRGDNYMFWSIFAFITAIFGTIGDLFESLIKRTYNLKDSGNIIPGHGGILDRIDSLLIATPAIFIFMIIWSIVVAQ